jgi:hypothetical protein
MSLQLSLLADVQRIERPWKRTPRTSRAAWHEAELAGRLRDREQIVGKALKYFWNKKQMSVMSSRLARWIVLSGKHWQGKEWAWVLLETRRALSGLREKGLADTKDDKIGRELLWRYREAGTGERPNHTKVAS